MLTQGGAERVVYGMAPLNDTLFQIIRMWLFIVVVFYVLFEFLGHHLGHANACNYANFDPRVTLMRVD